MKNQKQQHARNRRLVIKGNPMYGLRVVKSKKGKGSYCRKQSKTTDLISVSHWVFLLNQL